MLKDLFKLAFITVPIVIVIWGLRVNVGLVLADNDTILIMLSCLFLVSWSINIPLVLYIHAHIKRHVLSYIIMSLFILSLIGVLNDYVFDKNQLFFIHPFWAGLIFNIIVLALIDFTLMKNRKELAERKVSEIQRLKIEAEKKLLIQQLQPHFLFNAMSTLKSLIGENQESASNYTVHLSNFLRYTVKSHTQDIVPVHRELDFATDYMELQKERYVGAVYSEINLPDAILEKSIPVFSLQTLVENAFKHNQLSKENPLRIKIWYEDKMIKVSNNKIKKETTSQSTGTGLINLMERYYLISSSNIQIEDMDTTFTVSIKPLST